MGGYIISLFSTLDNRAKMSSDTDESETTVVMNDPTCSEPSCTDATETPFRQLSRYENYIMVQPGEYISFVART